MDLKSGNCLWDALSPDVRRFPKLDQDIRCDVAIVGAGITGAMIASTLADHGIDTVVVDRRQPSRGSTVACTALVLYEIDVPLIELTRRLGRDHAQRAYAACRRALDDVAEMVSRHQIDCGLRRTESLFLARDTDDLGWFAEEVAARRGVGIEARLVRESELHERYELLRPGAIQSAASLEVDPYRLTLGLIDAATRNGARVWRHECRAQLFNHRPTSPDWRRRPAHRM